MKKSLVIVLFFIVAVAQIATPFSMIIKREYVLKHGAQFKFRVAPVDPFDAFRGRYVAVRIENNFVPVPEGVDLKYGQKIYALIATDDVNKEGFARLYKITTVRPDKEPYLESRAGYVSKGSVWVNVPIDRYYMEEAAAPKAERLYRKYAMRGNKERDAYVQVKVKDGFAVVEQLYVGGKRIEDAVKELDIR